MENEKSDVTKKICKYCKSSIAKGAIVCPVCHKKIGMGLVGKIVAGFFGFVVLMGVIGSMSGNHADTSTSTTASSSSAVGSGGSVNQGDNGVLRISGTGDIVVLRTKAYMDEYVHDAVNKDTMGMAQMVYADEGFFVSNGTKVLVIDSAIGAREVRILEGKQIAQSGWVPMEFVQTQ